tara:strand:+ start:3859 stop:4695 length:837 start_codon:yes stop_codon:yes gene_type:complete
MKVGIVGLGLIGGSIGLKLQTLNHIVYGLTNNKINEKKAKERRLANFISCDKNILKECSIIILALPIKNLINPPKALIESLPKHSIITDVGSIKGPIIDVWEKLHPLFIGSHPMAGTEQKGVNAGYGELLNNAKWVITPTPRSDEKSLHILSNLIKSMGCDLCEANPKDHDIAVSLISHLPIFLASCLIDTAYNSDKELLNLSLKLASSGFADTSRVGGGNPELGLDLAKNNHTNILKSLKLFQKNISNLEKIISEKNWVLLEKKLLQSQKNRTDFLN